MAERINVEIHVVDRSNREESIYIGKADVRRQVQVSRLMAEMQRRYRLVGNYRLYIKETGRLLTPHLTIAEHGIRSDIVLLMMQDDRDESGLKIIRQIQEISDAPIPHPLPIRPGARLDYTDDRQIQLTWQISWQPAIIGRRDRTNISQNVLLAVDLAGLPQAEVVSRHHACITEETGTYYLHSISSHNVTYHNGQRLAYGQSQVLMSGDRIQIADFSLRFTYQEFC